MKDQICMTRERERKRQTDTSRYRGIDTETGSIANFEVDKEKVT